MTRTLKRYGRKDAGTPAASAPSNAAQGGTPDAKAPGQDYLTADAVSQLVTKAVEDALKKANPPAAPPPPPPAAPAPAPAAQDDSKALTAKDVADIVAKAFANFQPAPAPASQAPAGQAKQTRDPGDANRSQIEIPLGWTKGNLPVHAKQLLNVIMKRHMNDGIDAADMTKAIAFGDNLLLGRRMGKALTSTGSGTGDELVPTDMSSEIQRRLYLKSDLASAMAAFEIDMPTDPFQLPMTTTLPTMYLEAVENTAATGSDIGTAAPTLDAKTLMGMVQFSYELSEDAIVPVLPIIQDRMAEAAAQTVEDILLNGDTTATHMDTDYQTVAKHRARAWKGIRRLSLGVAGCYKDISSGGFTAANVSATLSQMGKYGVNASDVLFVIGTKTYHLLRNWDEFKTFDKAGDRATLFNGNRVMTVWGMPLIVSNFCREDVDDTGVNGASGNTYYVFSLLYRPNFMLGRRREFTIKVKDEITTPTWSVVFSMRKAFTPMETPSATVPACQTAFKFNS